MVAHEQGICGCHVHVAVPDRDTAVPGVQPAAALAAGAAGVERELGDVPQRRHRLRELAQHPVGPLAQCRAPAAPALRRRVRRDRCRACRTSGAMLDDGMVYWDARPSAKFPTVEVRVADVPATSAETVLLATLIRAAVMTALTEIDCGATEIRIPDTLLRAKYWRAARDGLIGHTRGAVVRSSRPCHRRWTNSANTTTSLPNWTASVATAVTAATGRSGSAGRGGAGMTSPTSSPRRPRPPCGSPLHQRKSRENLTGRLRRTGARLDSERQPVESPRSGSTAVVDGDDRLGVHRARRYGSPCRRPATSDTPCPPWAASRCSSPVPRVAFMGEHQGGGAAGGMSPTRCAHRGRRTPAGRSTGAGAAAMRCRSPRRPRRRPPPPQRPAPPCATGAQNGRVSAFTCASNADAVLPAVPGR